MSILSILMTGAVATGSLATAALSLGHYGWPAIIAAAVVGFGVSWPVAYLVSRRVKRLDPTRKHRDRTDARVIPKPGAPEA